MSPWALLAGATGACLALMTILWVVGLRIRNWSVVDPGWASCLVACAVLYAAAGDGTLARRAAMAVPVTIWGLRHAWLLLRHRVIGRPEEGRYVALRKTWGRGAFFAFFAAQGLLAAFLSGPFLLAAVDPRAGTSTLELGSLVLFSAALLGEALADAQLARWKADPAHRGRTCRAGLWSWSRHPNYFFEFVIWCAFALHATPSPWGWTAWYAPAVMLLLLLFVTGIPPAEAQALRSRGEDYRAYQREVGAFVPRPPRRDRASPS